MSSAPGLTFLALLGLSRMTGSIAVYYGLYFIYTFGYILSGPHSPQSSFPLVSPQPRHGGWASSYVGVGLVGAFGLTHQPITPLS